MSDKYTSILQFAAGAFVGYISHLLYSKKKRINNINNQKKKKKYDDNDNNDKNINMLTRLKLVLVVRWDIKKIMGNGKTCAQCAHAAVGACMNMDPELFELYEEQGQPKIVVKIPDEKALLELEKNARDHGLPTMLIADQGRTRLPPNTITVLAVGPAPIEEIDAVCGHLKLMS